MKKCDLYVLPVGLQLLSVHGSTHQEDALRSVRKIRSEGAGTGQRNGLQGQGYSQDKSRRRINRDVASQNGLNERFLRMKVRKKATA